MYPISSFLLSVLPPLILFLPLTDNMVYHTPYSQLCSTLFDVKVSGSLSSYAPFLHLTFTSCASLNIPFRDHAFHNLPCLHGSFDG